MYAQIQIIGKPNNSKFWEVIKQKDLILIYEKKVQAVMVDDSTNINKTEATTSQLRILSIFDRATLCTE